MIHILLYWNHICVLHKQEKIFLENLADNLKAEGIDLEVRYFGLGYPEHMSDYLAREDAVLPDIMVSADLEVFEDRRIYWKFENDLYPVRNWVKLRKSPALEAISQDSRLLPFAAIPLVYYTRDLSCCQGKTVNQIPDLAFGGIHNSAGKTLVKTVWSRYGREEAFRFLIQSHVSDMPIQAYKQVYQGMREVSLVPSIYALRADGKHTFLCRPKEGPMLVPSFFCARNSITEEAARRVAEGILCRELCEFYEANGNLILYPDFTKGTNWHEKEYLTPLPDWYDQVSSQEFYGLYGEGLSIQM